MSTHFFRQDTRMTYRRAVCLTILFTSAMAMQDGESSPELSSPQQPDRQDAKVPIKGYKKTQIDLDPTEAVISKYPFIWHFQGREYERYCEPHYDITTVFWTCAKEELFIAKVGETVTLPELSDYARAHPELTNGPIYGGRKAVIVDKEEVWGKHFKNPEPKYYEAIVFVKLIDATGIRHGDILAVMPQEEEIPEEMQVQEEMPQEEEIPEETQVQEEMPQEEEIPEETETQEMLPPQRGQEPLTESDDDASGALLQEDKDLREASKKYDNCGGCEQNDLVGLTTDMDHYKRTLEKLSTRILLEKMDKLFGWTASEEEDESTASSRSNSVRSNSVIVARMNPRHCQRETNTADADA